MPSIERASRSSQAEQHKSSSSKNTTSTPADEIEVEEATADGDAPVTGEDDVEMSDAYEKAGQEEDIQGTEGAAEAPEWDWVSLLDSEVSRHPAVFTKDGRYFFLPSSASIKIHSAATGEVVSTLTPPVRLSKKTGKPRPTHPITCLSINPSNPFQLLTGSLDGSVRVWDFLDGVLLRTISVQHPITHMCAHATLKDQVIVAADRPLKKKPKTDSARKPRSLIYRVTLSASPTLQLIGKTPVASGLALSPSASHLVVSASRSTYVFSISGAGKPEYVKYVSGDKITCMAFHPEEDWFATGDEKGVVKFWYCVPSEDPDPNHKKIEGEKHAPTTSHHWHAHPVRSLCFTPNGAYLLSGGEEAVIVVWQLHSGRKEFVPRLGGPINWLTVKQSLGGDGEEEWLAGLVDGTLVWVSSGGLKMTRTVARIKLDASAIPSPPPTSVPLAIHPSTSHLILPSSHPSSLQVYSSTSHTLLSELEVHPSNRVSRRDPTSSPVPSSRVERVAVSHGGDWMATIDVRRGGEDADSDTEENGVLTRLKIWWWDPGKKEWSLNTRVEKPHGSDEVTGLAFSPSPSREKGERNCLLATTGKDGQIKTWRLRVVKEKEGEEVFWVNRSSFSYRDHCPNAVAFSGDGSLLVVAQGPCITLWDPMSNGLQRVLTSEESSVAHDVVFIGPYGRWLVVQEKSKDSGSRKGKRRSWLALWDLLTCSLTWRAPLDAADVRIVAHPTEPTFVVFKRANSIKNPTTTALLFHAASSQPFRIRSLPFSLLEVSWYPLLPPSFDSADFSLVGITDKMKVVLLGDAIQKPVAEGSAPRDIRTVSSARRTLFEDVFGTTALVDLTQEANIPSSLPAEEFLQKGDSSIFDGPAYMLPPMSTLFGSFMDGMLRRRESEEPSPEIQDVPAEAPEEDDRMDVEVQERIVDDAEVDMLVEFFKQQLLQERPRTPPPVVTHQNGNGKHKSTNGSHPPSPVRGSPPRKDDSSQRLQTLRSAAFVVDVVGPSPTSATGPGTSSRKRKKSSG